ncbi:MAG: ABC transporter ATP-binding protein [Solirubrobacteraceae bacterium]
MSPTSTTTATGAVEVTSLSKRFGSTIAVDDLSFSVSYGRIVGFLGPNGAGKTTTLRALLGLITPTAGTTMIDGYPYAELRDPVRTVGASLDGGNLHPGRSARNHLRVLARAAGISRTRVEELLTLVELQSAADRRAGDYSLGMRQRLGLAAALLGDPQVLVLDEPANGLDPQGIRWLRDFLRSLASDGRAILVSSHVLAEVAQTVDDVVVIRGGRSVMQASLDRLIAAHGRGVRVAGADAGRLAELFRDRGADVGADPGGAIVIRDRTVEEIAPAIAEQQFVITALAPIESSLEEIYLTLTGGTPNGGPS